MFREGIGMGGRGTTSATGRGIGVGVLRQALEQAQQANQRTLRARLYVDVMQAAVDLAESGRMDALVGESNLRLLEGVLGNAYGSPGSPETLLGRLQDIVADGYGERPLGTRMPDWVQYKDAAKSYVDYFLGLGYSLPEIAAGVHLRNRW